MPTSIPECQIWHCRIWHCHSYMLRHCCKHMRLYYLLLIHIENRYYTVLWPCIKIQMTMHMKISAWNLMLWTFSQDWSRLTIQAIIHSSPFTGHWDTLYGVYRKYSMYMQQRFLCGGAQLQLNLQLCTFSPDLPFKPVFIPVCSLIVEISYIVCIRDKI